jgi:quinol monooxygenase YgiN
MEIRMDAAETDTASAAMAGTPAPVLALFVRVIAKAGKAKEVESLLRGALDAVMDEHETTNWFAVRFGERDFAIFDTFPHENGRQAHLAGEVGRTLVALASELFEGAPKIENARTLAYKLPSDSGQVRS